MRNITEYNIEVDKDNNKIGLRPREDFYTGKYIHRASHLILFNSKKEILLQVRSKNKRWYPNLITFSVSGTVGDETYYECMLKEMNEEIGITTRIQEVFTYSHFDEVDNAWHRVFIGISDETIKADSREIQEIMWITVDDLKQKLKTTPEKFTPVFIKGMNIYLEKYHKE